jgi:hypothetical protein
MKLLTAVMLGALCSAAGAQTVYRCGPDGREYSHSPCAGAAIVEAGDARNDRQRREAAEVAERDADLAERLQRERHSREGIAARQSAAGFHFRPAVTNRVAEQPPTSAKTSKPTTRKKRSRKS